MVYSDGGGGIAELKGVILLPPSGFKFLLESFETIIKLIRIKSAAHITVYFDIFFK
jgi:hypothetical protein